MKATIKLQYNKQELESVIEKHVRSLLNIDIPKDGFKITVRQKPDAWGNLVTVEYKEGK